MASPDPNAWLRRLPIAVGILGSALLMVNRLLTSALTESQARSDVMGVILCAVLVLTGLLWQRVQPKTPDMVQLAGKRGLNWMRRCPMRYRRNWPGRRICC